MRVRAGVFITRCRQVTVLWSVSRPSRGRAADSRSVITCILCFIILISVSEHPNARRGSVERRVAQTTIGKVLTLMNCTDPFVYASVFCVG